MENKIEKKFENPVVLNQGKESSNVLAETLTSHTEKVTKIVGEDLPQTSGQTQVVKKTSFFSGISQKISGLLTSSKPKSEVIPVRKVQEKELIIKLEKEKESLLSEAKRIENSKNFSADSLEQIMYRVRYIQQLLSDLIYMAADKLEGLYRKYVLRKG